MFALATKRVAIAAVALGALVGVPILVVASPWSDSGTSGDSSDAAAAVNAPSSVAAANAPTGSDDQRIDRILAGMTLDEKIGQLFVVSFAGTTATEADGSGTAANMKALGVATAAEAVRTYNVGGVVYFSANVSSPPQLAALSGELQDNAIDSGAGIPLSISIDQEGGTVWRLNAPASISPGSMAVGATDNPNNAFDAGKIMAQEMRSLGINWNLAPVADVNTPPYNQVDGARSFGDDSEKVPVFVRAAVQGQRAGGVASAVKHFPGLGSSKANSDFGIARSTQTAGQFRSRDFPAFSAAIDSGVEAVLTAHLVAPKLVGSSRPTSLSRKVVTRILRQELGFRGAVITDSLQAAALTAIPPGRVVVDAFVAGNDMLLMPVNLPAAIKAIRAAARDGTVTRERLNDSVRRILQMKMNAGMLDPPWQGTLADVAATVGAADHLAEMDRIARDSVTLIAPEGAAAPLSGTTGRILVAGTGSTAVPTMAEALTVRGVETTAMVTGFGPSGNIISEAVAAARPTSAVVLLTYNVFADAGQQRLISRLSATGVPLIVVPVNGPYDAAWADGAAAVATSYGYAPTNLDAVAEALTGGRTPGVLPVAVPAAGSPPRATLYPRGWGLTWAG